MYCDAMWTPYIPRDVYCIIDGSTIDDDDDYNRSDTSITRATASVRLLMARKMVSLHWINCNENSPTNERLDCGLIQVQQGNRR